MSSTSTSLAFFLIFMIAVNFNPSVCSSLKVNLRCGLSRYAASIIAGFSVLSYPLDSFAATKEIGNIETSGIIFKDSLKVNSFHDPKIFGITLYLSDFDRPITEKLSNDFFNDPSSSSLTCVQTLPINVNEISKSISSDSSGEEVFEESRNLFFKQIRIRRIFDKETNTVVYASYSTRLNKDSDSNKSRFKSSLCAVHLSENI